ncbi:hypothetical protein [Ramlibacter sp. PS4R-6]|uniref:hypothetical protein n=1 Tax=Ramlibacter sp. PS4R-6 TaxID=3133438 RepID=UPI00309CB6FA
MKKSLVALAAFAAVSAFAGEIDYATVNDAPVQAAVSRDAVKAETLAAIRQGQVATGEIGTAFVAKQVVVTPRVDNRAELAQAVRHGDIAYGEAGF